MASSCPQAKRSLNITYQAPHRWSLTSHSLPTFSPGPTTLFLLPSLDQPISSYFLPASSLIPFHQPLLSLSSTTCISLNTLGIVSPLVFHLHPFFQISAGTLLFSEKPAWAVQMCPFPNPSYFLALSSISPVSPGMDIVFHHLAQSLTQWMGSP